MSHSSQGYYSRIRCGHLTDAEAPPLRTWNPGDYASFQDGTTTLSGGNLTAGADAAYTALGATEAAKGVSITVLWPDVETAFNTYDDTLIDTHLARCEAEGLQLCVRASHKTFSITDHAVPAYMRAGVNDALYGNDDGGGTGNSSGGEYEIAGGYVAKLNIPAVYDRFMAWIQHFADKYNDNPNFEMIYFNESAQGTPVNYTLTTNVTADFAAALISMGADSKAIMSKKLIGQLFNFPAERLATIYAASIANGVGLGHADVFTSTIIGETRNTDPYNHNISLAGAAAAFSAPNNYDRSYMYFADAGGKVPIMSIVSPDSWDHSRSHHVVPATYIPPTPIQQIFEWCRDQLNSTHIFWTWIDTAVPTYNGATPYDYRDIVKSGGTCYQSKAVNNVGNALANTTYWHDVGDTFPSASKQLIPHLVSKAGIPAGGLNGAYPSEL